MDLKNSYKSSLHYLVLQSSHSGLSFEDFLLYFSNRDIGKLNSLTCETVLRDALRERLSSFYSNNKVTSEEEFRLVAACNVVLEKIVAPKLLIGELYFLAVPILKPQLMKS